MRNLAVIKEHINFYYLKFRILFAKLGFKIFLLTVISYLLLQSELAIISGVILYIMVCLNRCINIYNDKNNYEYFNPDIKNTFDDIIQDCLNEYIIFNRAYEKVTTITTQEENRISKEIASMVIDRLSSTIKKQLLLYYNEYSFDEILAHKVYMAVLAYTLDNNKTERNNNKTVENSNKKVDVMNLLGNG